jgi:hypothetical protein
MSPLDDMLAGALFSVGSLGVRSRGDDEDDDQAGGKPLLKDAPLACEGA